MKPHQRTDWAGETDPAIETDGWAPTSGEITGVYNTVRRRRGQPLAEHAPIWYQVLVRQGLPTLMVLAMGWAGWQVYKDHRADEAVAAVARAQHDTAMVKALEKIGDQGEETVRTLHELRFYLKEHHR